MTHFKTMSNFVKIVFVFTVASVIRCSVFALGFGSVLGMV